MLYARLHADGATMNGFTLQLQGATESVKFEQVSTFVGNDASGSFGILPGHARFMSALSEGLARFRVRNQHWQYIALPGALLYFHENSLSINCQYYLLDDDYQRISQTLQQHLSDEQDNLRNIKKSLFQMEEEVLKRLWKIKQFSS